MKAISKLNLIKDCGIYIADTSILYSLPISWSSITQNVNIANNIKIYRGGQTLIWQKAACTSPQGGTMRHHLLILEKRLTQGYGECTGYEFCRREAVSQNLWDVGGGVASCTFPHVGAGKHPSGGGGMWKGIWRGCVHRVTLTETSILVPYLSVKCLQLIWRLGTCRWNLPVCDLQMSCRDMTYDRM